jgi:D-alanine-D-alanine ligase
MTICLIRSYADKPWRSSETYDRIEKSLASEWPVATLATRDPAEFERRLGALKRQEGDGLFVFNIAEYLDEETRTGFLPELLDGMGVPHLGSPAAVCALALDKARSKEALIASGIPTPRYFVVRAGEGEASARAAAIGYPLFVKPVGEGGHIGIGADSIVRNPEELDRKLRSLFEVAGGEALVEEYVDEEGMREFSVGVLDGRDRHYAPIEIDWASMRVEHRILSHEVAMNDRERVMPVADEEARKRAVELAARTFDAVGARDYSRVDIRMNATGWYVLEINTMPGLGPQSFLPGAALSLHGIGYQALIRRLARDSMARQGLVS